MILSKFKAYVINLEKDKERMSFMERQLKDTDLSFERFPAIYGKDFDFNNFYNKEEAINKNGYFLSPGELGCALSHRLVLEKAKAEDLDYVLIFEDDVLIPKNFKEILEKEITKNNKNQKWEYLSFDYMEPSFIFIVHWFKTIWRNYKMKIQDKSFFIQLKFFTYSFLKIFYILPLSLFEIFRNYFYKYFTVGRAVKFYRPLYLAGCYVAKREGVEKLLSLATPLVYPADRLQNEAKKQLGLKFYAYAPCVVFQQRVDFGSNIANVKKIDYV